MRKVDLLPGAAISPKSLLATLSSEPDDEIEQLVTIVKWKNGDITAGWTRMSTALLCLMSQFFSAKTTQEIFEPSVND